MTQYFIFNLRNDTIEQYLDPNITKGVYLLRSTIPRTGTFTLQLDAGQALDIPASVVLL